ncbi:AAA family ATPase [Mycobacterium gordonae]|uniref:AAA family ATPase n=1 Tax=Mycobacterium gordonae TaxID=1778 RepID=A0A1X1VLH3_MYCGO|nr:AAA family ATPase [Mycobacterium gordonae]ORV69864.1 hypothetical protein AWC08_06035 [Mycobacterium gordonae]
MLTNPPPGGDAASAVQQLPARPPDWTDDWPADIVAEAFAELCFPDNIGLSDPPDDFNAKSWRALKSAVRKRLPHRNGRTSPTVAPGANPKYVKAVVDKTMAELVVEGSGARNDKLNKVALRCARVLPSDPAIREMLRRELVAACDSNHLNFDDGEHDTHGTISSAFQAADRFGPADVPEPKDIEPKVHSLTETEFLHELVGNRWTPPRDDSRSSDPAAEGEALEGVITDRMRALRVVREAKRRLDDEERPQAIPPAVKGLTQLLGEPDTPVVYRINELAPEDGRVLLSAQYKAGKTTVVGNLLRSLADGEPFLGRFTVATRARNVVLIDTEMSETTLRRWLADQRITNTRAVADVVALRGKVSALNLPDDRSRAQWAARLASIRCDYLILDCLRPVLDALGLDENHDAGRFLVAFDALLAEAGIGNALIVQHMGHANERARGDSRLQDWPDAIWRLVRETDQPDSARFFTAHGRDVDVAEGRRRSIRPPGGCRMCSARAGTPRPRPPRQRPSSCWPVPRR